MSNKIFSLIHGDGIHISPKKKIIKGSEISKVVSSIEILKAVKNDAEKYKENVLAECEVLKEQAQKEGFEEGFNKWAEHLAKLEEEITKVRVEMEKVIIPISLKAAKKILGKELETSETAIVDIVGNCLKAVSQHKKITIYVSKKDYSAVEAGKGNLKQLFENLEAFSIRERSDITPGGCVIETEGGIINAQLDNQWRILEQAFDNLLKPKNTHK